VCVRPYGGERGNLDSRGKASSGTIPLKRLCPNWLQKSETPKNPNRPQPSSVSKTRCEARVIQRIRWKAPLLYSCSTGKRRCAWKLVAHVATLRRRKGETWIPGTSQLGHNSFKEIVPQLAPKVRNAQKSETPTVAAHGCRGLARIHREGGQGIQL